MVELSIAEYAVRLGVSADTVRRRIRAGQIPARTDARGRYVVIIPSEAAEVLHAVPTQDAQDEADATELVQTLREQVSDLQQQLGIANRRLDDAERERTELHQLVSQAQQLAGARMLPAPTEIRSAGSPETRAPSWWREFREGKRGLGASLTLTGVVALIAGVFLHFALQHQVIGSAAHLGYVVGLVGLLTFLIGLVLVF